MSTVWFSLRKRLLGLLLGGVAIAWLLTVLFSYLDAHHEVDELFDAQLAQAAQTLLALSAGEAGDGDDDYAPFRKLHAHGHGHHHGREHREPGEMAHKYQRHLRFQIWLPDGSLLLRSENAPETPLTAVDGFSETDGKDGHWRYFSQWNPARTLQVQVSEDHRVRDELIGRIARRLLLPALFGLPLIGLWVWIATRKGLSSLAGVTRQIASRDPGQLAALEPRSAPEEIRPMIDALNDLFRRVDVALENERRFTADAAHELRTPLAALQAQLQVALRARDEAERRQSLDQLQSGLARASRLVAQMLELARLDPESGLPDPRPVDLRAVVEDVCAELGPAILARQIDFDFSAGNACRVIGQEEWLRVLVRNLVDNAIRYTPPGGSLRIDIAGDGSLCRLRVADSGPGIPVEQRAAVLRRFHRLEQSEQPGSGLGLAIVARIAELHGAAFELGESEVGGLLVSLGLPLAR